MAFKVTAEPQRFNEAADWFLKRVVLTQSEAEELGNDAGRRAFWIGGGLQLTQIQRVFDKVAKAVEDGTPFDEWRKSVKNELKNDAHAETVFRNATQRALNAGRWRQMREPGILAFRPYWLFDGIKDSRQSPICKKCNGVILPADHAWWSTHTPLLHHRCRSSIRNLRVLEAQRRGVTNVPPVDAADDGFGLSPERDPDWKPDPARHDAELLQELNRKQAAGRPAPKPPARAPNEHDPKHWEGQYAGKYGEAAGSVGWGRAMLERGLDRTSSDVVGELERLGKAGHPTLDSAEGRLATKMISLLDANRPLRGTLQGEWLKSYVALSEHTRTVTPAPLKLQGSRLPKGAKAFYDLTLSDTVTRPSDWTVKRHAGRSYAAPTARRLVIRSKAEDGTFVHEIAHAIEFTDARALQRSLAFLKARTGAEPLQLLSKLKGIPAYGNEQARPDKFVEPYMGKDYGNVATEITSMGYELMVGRSGNLELRDLTNHDSEYFLFLLGQLAGR